jgi:hypothetical protein
MSLWIYQITRVTVLLEASRILRKEGWKGWAVEERDVSRYWMTYRKTQVAAVEFIGRSIIIIIIIVLWLAVVLFS